MTMKNELFLDRSGLLSLFDEDDARHQKATAIFAQAHWLVTTNYVLAEFVPLTHVRGLHREKSLSFLRTLILLPRIEVVWIDDQQHHAAMDLLEARLDKSYSLCDAVSFVLMRERQILEALTTDRHFVQEGFVRLLEG